MVFTDVQVEHDGLVLQVCGEVRYPKLDITALTHNGLPVDKETLYSVTSDLNFRMTLVDRLAAIPKQESDRARKSGAKYN